MQKFSSIPSICIAGALAQYMIVVDDGPDAVTLFLLIFGTVCISSSAPEGKPAGSDSP